MLRTAGYNVQAEYYINDAGNQMDNLAASVNARYLMHFGVPAEIPENGYHGHDIIETAEAIIAKDGDAYLKMPEEERLSYFKERAYAEKLAALRRDLAAFNVQYDNWFSERTLHPAAIEDVCETLKQRGKAYEKRVPCGLSRRNMATTKIVSSSVTTAYRRIWRQILHTIK